MNPYGWYLVVYIIAVVASNVARYLRPAWAGQALFFEAFAAVALACLVIRRFYQPRSSASRAQTANDDTSDNEDVTETRRRLQRNARRRELRSQRRELEARAQMELNHAQVTARIVRAGAKKKVPSEKPAEPVEAPSKWDRLLGDDDPV